MFYEYDKCSICPMNHKLVLFKSLFIFLVVYTIQNFNRFYGIYRSDNNVPLEEYSIVETLSVPQPSPEPTTTQQPLLTDQPQSTKLPQLTETATANRKATISKYATINFWDILYAFIPLTPNVRNPHCIWLITHHFIVCEAISKLQTILIKLIHFKLFTILCHR